MRMETVKIIQIGLGHMGKAWIATLAATPGAETVAWVDNNPAAFEPLIQQGKIQREHCYTSLETALEREQADAVLIVTPPELHEQACVLAAAAGKHILCEKPLAHTLESAQRAVEAAEQAGVILQVAQNRRHTDFIHTMRELVREGKYGRPGQVFVTFRHLFDRDSFRDTMEHPLLVDMANHHFDSIRSVLGAEPVGVRGIGWSPYWSRFQGTASAVAVFEYADGLRVVYEGTWHTIDAEKSSNGCNWRIECERGVILCENERVYEAPAGGEKAAVNKLVMQRQYGAYLVDEFLRAVRGGGPPESSGRDNLGTLAMVFGAVEAVNTGNAVKLK
jgi:predicted dehydrogenase